METSWLKRNIPILSWLPAYNRSWLTADAIAGLTVWGLVVPESMAYAGVAGLPPQFGLYTLAVSLLVYALLGDFASSVCPADFGDGGPDRFVGDRRDGRDGGRRQPARRSIRWSTSSMPGVRPGGWRGLSGRRPGAPGLHHPVPVQAGAGWLCDRPGGVCHGRAAQQALRRGETVRQYGAEVFCAFCASCPRPTGSPSPWELAASGRC